MLHVQHAKGHLDILPRQCRLFRITHAEHEIRHDKAVKAPALLEDLGEQRSVLPAPFAVDAVVGAHHRGHTGIHHALEMRQVHFMERTGIDAHVHGKAGILHRVEAIVLDAGHGMALHALGQRGTHLTQQQRIFSIALLRAAPGRMPGEVDAYAAE